MYYLAAGHCKRSFTCFRKTQGIFVKINVLRPNFKSVVLVGQKSLIYYIQVVVVALLSVDLVESVDLVSVYLVVNCTYKNIEYI